MDEIIVLLLRVAVLMVEKRCEVSKSQASALWWARNDVIKILYRLTIATERPVEQRTTLDLPL